MDKRGEGQHVVPKIYRCNAWNKTTIGRRKRVWQWIRVLFLRLYGRCYGDRRMRLRFEDRADILQGDHVLATVDSYDYSKNASLIAQIKHLPDGQGGLYTPTSFLLAMPRPLARATTPSQVGWGMTTS